MNKPNIYICSSASFSGKSALCLGLALKFKELGYKIGYFKPVGWEMSRGSTGEKIDDDAQLMQKVLDLNLPMEVVCPVILGARFLEESSRVDPRVYENRIAEAYERASNGMDLMLIEGPYSFGVGASIGLDPMELAKKLGSTLVLVSCMERDTAVGQIIWVKNAIEASGGSLFGVILNCIPKTDLERVKAFGVDILKKNGIQILGIIPESIPLRAPTVREICDSTKCTILAGEKNLGNLVEDFLVGAMTPESALSYFRRSLRKAVITGGDRTDIQLAALQTDVSALVLTGNYYPDIRVLSKADELGVPVLLVPGDTYSTIREISTLTGRIKPTDTRKIQLAQEIVEEHVDWQRILAAVAPTKSGKSEEDR